VVASTVYAVKQLALVCAMTQGFRPSFWSRCHCSIASTLNRQSLPRRNPGNFPSLSNR